MRKIYAFSGPQGSGKTTLLNELENRGLKVDDFKASRTVQNILGVTLEQATHTPEKMMDFQNKILDIKYKREELIAVDGDELILTDRSFLDIFVYSALWASKAKKTNSFDLEDASIFIRHFADMCSDYQQIYSGIFIVPYSEHITWVDDHNRAKKEDIDSFNNIMKMFIQTHQPQNVPVFYIDALSVSDRADQVLEFLERA